MFKNIKNELKTFQISNKLLLYKTFENSFENRFSELFSKTIPKYLKF